MATRILLDPHRTSGTTSTAKVAPKRGGAEMSIRRLVGVPVDSARNNLAANAREKRLANVRNAPSSVGRSSAVPPVRIELDVLDAVVRAMLDAPEDVYWARRLLDLVRDPVVAARLRPHLVVAVKRWVTHDPSFFVHERYLSEQLAVWAWPREVLEDLDAALDLEDPSLSHLILGRLWLAARRPPTDMLDFYARASRHLREVGPHLQIGSWHEALCEALGVAEPEELDRRAREILDCAPPSARERALLAILRGAARTANWTLYDTHRRLYGALDQDGTRRDSEIIKLDGLRAEQQLVRRDRLPDFDALMSAPTVRPG